MAVHVGARRGLVAGSLSESWLPHDGDACVHCYRVVLNVPGRVEMGHARASAEPDLESPQSAGTHRTLGAKLTSVVERDDAPEHTQRSDYGRPVASRVGHSGDRVFVEWRVCFVYPEGAGTEHVERMTRLPVFDLVRGAFEGLGPSEQLTYDRTPHREYASLVFDAEPAARPRIEAALVRAGFAPPGDPDCRPATASEDARDILEELASGPTYTHRSVGPTVDASGGWECGGGASFVVDRAR